MLEIQLNFHEKQLTTKQSKTRAHHACNLDDIKSSNIQRKRVWITDSRVIFDEKELLGSQAIDST